MKFLRTSLLQNTYRRLPLNMGTLAVNELLSNYAIPSPGTNTTKSCSEFYHFGVLKATYMLFSDKNHEDIKLREIPKRIPNNYNSKTRSLVAYCKKTGLVLRNWLGSTKNFRELKSRHVYVIVFMARRESFLIIGFYN